jgi:hypothetical protein
MDRASSVPGLHVAGPVERSNPIGLFVTGYHPSTLGVKAFEVTGCLSGSSAEGADPYSQCIRENLHPNR